MNRASLPSTAASTTTSSSIANRKVWCACPGTSGYRASASLGVRRSPAYSMIRTPSGMGRVAKAPAPWIGESRILKGRVSTAGFFTPARYRGGGVEAFGGGPSGCARGRHPLGAADRPLAATYRQLHQRVGARRWPLRPDAGYRQLRRRCGANDFAGFSGIFSAPQPVRVLSLSWNRPQAVGCTTLRLQQNGNPNYFE